ncbi:MAG: Rpn family recombination-promoting nuclease/putative transposase [Gemmatimonadetes bacterium]|nr:Rpn family recombination-promoting nuclease/putative transposase [Gemmatimonadota bacterium]MYE91884.1 Rpn family recombination-promoting nuclease/putative transposase [Gemmatimonadota bacterium]MYJ09659.1 Rpn family recombination-promoting nuclease/putative transposase [Gemmatimonadota bacterium]
MPGKQKRPEGPKHDASYKNFFTHARTVEDTLRAAAGDLARHLDFATLERMPDSFVTEHLGQRHADMLWRIGTTGQPAWTPAPPLVSSHRDPGAGPGLAAAGQRARDDREVRAGSDGGGPGRAGRLAG